MAAKPPIPGALPCLESWRGGAPSLVVFLEAFALSPLIVSDDSIVRALCCVFLESTEAALVGNFTPISRRPTNGAMRIAWVHSGALREPLCIQGDVMAHFVGQREIGVKVPMRAASVDPESTQLMPLTIVFYYEMVKTEVPEDGNPPRALVLTKLVE